MNKFFMPFQNNIKIIKHFLTKNEIKTLYSNLNPKQMLIYNEKLLKYLYGIKDINNFDNLSSKIQKWINGCRKKIIKCDTQKYGLLIIKPEMLIFENDLIKLLNKNNFIVEAVLHKKMKKKQFMSLYKRQLTSIETQYDMPTRMLNIIEKPIHILVVSRKDCKNCSDELNNLKGKLGVINDHTFRGIGAKYIGQIVKKASFKELLQIDPIQMCRGNVKYNFGNDNSFFINLKYPILFFIANCVHVPDYKELEEHTKILLTKKEICLFINTLNFN